ncbi:MAG TPA: FRG domain-containing protein [Chitinophagaceae bacterium]|nr:FRG domain-containing protein [Chitinophagaceae bacterium]
MEAVVRTDIMDWKDFVNEFDSYRKSDRFIFRGQSNEVVLMNGEKDPKGRIITTKLKEWELISSFNRFYQGPNKYRFITFLSQQLQDDLFRAKYGHYMFVEKFGIDKWSRIDKIMFLQYYGCPTCFIDFTFNPLIALYFAIASMRGSSGTTYDNEGNIFNYSDDCFLSIYQIDCKILCEVLGIKQIDFGNDFSLNYRNYEILLNENSSQAAVISLLLTPNANKENYNLKKQDGCFLIYDNHDFNFKGRGFERFLSEYTQRRNISLSEPIIKIFRIAYNSVFANRHHGEFKKEGLFGFLAKKNISGAYLFNDLQGLKYDFNFFHDN